MSLLDALVAWNHTPTIQAYLDGRPVDLISANVDMGFDVGSSVAQVVLAEVPSWITTHGLRKKLEIWMGYDGFTLPVFKGWTEDDTRRYFPFDNELNAAGHLKLAQYQYPDGVAYANQTDKEIKEDLLTKAGIPDYSVEGENATDLGTIQNVTLEAGQATWDLINQIDQLFGYKTFDGPDGMVRSMRVSGVPGAGAAFAYVQGATTGNQLLINSISRPRTIRGIHNKVIVTGLPQDPLTPTATRQAANPLVPTPPTYVSYDYRSDLVETDAVASAVALRLMGELNGVLEEVTFESVGNPWLSPGMTISITAAQIGLAVATNFYVQHVTHSFTESGFYDTVIATRVEGGPGYELGRPPVPVFTYRITKEQYDVVGVPTVMYTVTCDGSASWDPDSPPDTLTFAWSNNKNADVGTATTYSTAFTQAQMDAATKPTITLVVNDADATSPAGTLTQTILLTGQVVTRDLYVAADGRAEATKEGDVDWNTWTPGAGTVISVPPIVTGDYGYWGLSNGKLMQSADHLATAPTEIEDFGSQINCIYVNRVNPDRVTVGLANGQVWLSLDADQGAASTWTMLYDGASAILAIWEDDRQQGQYRFTMGKQGLITYDNFANIAVQIEFADGDTARKIAVSRFANYFCGTTAAGPAVKRDDGTPITFSDGTVDVHAIAHHIRDDVLYAARLAGDGTTINTYQKAAGATAFTAKATVALGGQPNSMVAEPDNQLEFFLAADQGLYKTFDGFTSMVRVRDYTAAGINGSQVGIGALALPVEGFYTYVFFRTAAGAPKIGRTANVKAASPTWVAMSVTGLPASIDSDQSNHLTLDPFDPQAGYVTVKVSGVFEIYYNANLVTGTWTKIYDLAIHNTLTGDGATAIYIKTRGGVSPPALGTALGGVVASIAEQGFVAWLVTVDESSNRVIHSHNYGTSLTASPALNYQRLDCLAWGQWDINRAYFFRQNTLATVCILKVSTDGGHSFGADINMTNFGGGVNAKLPYTANPNDYIILVGFSAAFTKVVVNAAGTSITETVLASPGDLQPYTWELVPEDANYIIFAVDLVSKLSTDGGVSWSADLGNPQVSALAGFQKANHLVGDGDAVANTVFVATSTDLATFTDRTGNLVAAVGTPDGLMFSVIPAWVQAT